MNRIQILSPRKIFAPHQTLPSPLSTNKSPFIKPPSDARRPMYICTKEDQGVYPNTFHTYHQGFKPGRRQNQQKHESRAMNRSCIDMKLYGDLLIPNNRKKKFEQSYVVTDPLTDSLVESKNRTMTKSYREAVREKRILEDGKGAKESLYKWKY